MLVLPMLVLLAGAPDRLDMDVVDLGIGADSAARKRWLTPEMYRDVEMVCSPSSKSEIAVFILRAEKFAKKKAGPVVIVREPVTPIHRAFSAAMPKENFVNENGEGEWARMAAAELKAAASIQVEIKEEACTDR